MPFKISFFPTVKHRVFTYRPRFYDPVKEELQERIAKSRAEKAAADAANADTAANAPADGSAAAPQAKPYVPGASLRGSFQRMYEDQRKESKRFTVTRFIIILSLILLMVGVFYLANGMNVLLNLIMNK